MAIYNEILAGRFARGIQKLFSMKGGPPARQLGGEIMPSFDTEAAMALENRLLFGWRSFARSTGIAAGGAGNRSAYRLRNPANSGAIAVMEKILFFGTSLDQPFVTRGPTGTADLGASDAGNNSIRDVRMGAINSILSASSSTNAGAVTGVVVVEVAYVANGQADAILVPNHEIVLAPNDVLTFWPNTLNFPLNISLMWRERALEESETLLVSSG